MINFVFYFNNICFICTTTANSVGSAELGNTFLSLHMYSYKLCAFLIYWSTPNASRVAVPS